jgi:hypothetical protein
VPAARQQITMSPTGVEITNLAGTLTISMDVESQTIRIDGANIEIGSATTASVKIKGGSIEIGEQGTTAQTAVRGTMVNIN